MGHDEALGSGRPEILADFRALAVFRKKPFCAVGGLPMKRISHYFFGRDSCHRLLKGGGLAALQKGGRTRVQQDWLQGGIEVFSVQRGDLFLTQGQGQMHHPSTQTGRNDTNIHSVKREA